jgi:dihydrofolate reductase
MRKLVVTEFLTLDGVYQSPGDPDEDRDGGFEFGGWQLPYFDDDLGAFASHGIAANGGYLFGRRTYEIFAAFWPTQPDTDMFAKTLNGLPKYVASTTLREPLGWQHADLLKGDIPTAVRKLKQGTGKNVTVLGSGRLVQTLLANDLVDELELMIHPLIVGSGKRLFPDRSALSKFRVVESSTSSTGVLIVRYEPAG